MSERGAPAPLQVILRIAPGLPLVAGVPAVLRVAHTLVEDGPTCVVLVGAVDRFAEAWRRQLSTLPCRSVWSTADAVATLDGDLPALVLSPDGLPETSALRAFLASARGRAKPTAWIWSGRTIATYYPEARDIFPAGPIDGIVATAASWYELRDSNAVKRAEADLVRSLRKDTDGYIARFDRRISIALSQVLIRTPVTPNAVTATSLAVGLVGGVLLAVPRPLVTLAGALLLWMTCILDGCDGEIARLKLMATFAGARFDVIADNVVHVAIFVALALNLHLAHPDSLVIPAGVILLTGVLASMLAVWRLILHTPASPRGALELFYERVASRDFIYLILLLVAIRRLEWFLWAAAVGSHVFWLSLCWLAWRRR